MSEQAIYGIVASETLYTRVFLKCVLIEIKLHHSPLCFPPPCPSKLLSLEAPPCSPNPNSQVYSLFLEKLLFVLHTHTNPAESGSVYMVSRLHTVQSIRELIPGGDLSFSQQSIVACSSLSKDGTLKNFSSSILTCLLILLCSHS